MPLPFQFAERHAVADACSVDGRSLPERRRRLAFTSSTLNPAEECGGFNDCFKMAGWNVFLSASRSCIASRGALHFPTECFSSECSGRDRSLVIETDDANGRFAWILDPEGNKIELWEPKRTAPP